jgi:hypothetical protein
MLANGSLIRSASSDLQKAAFGSLLALPWSSEQDACYYRGVADADHVKFISHHVEREAKRHTGWASVLE